MRLLARCKSWRKININASQQCQSLEAKPTILRQSPLKLIIINVLNLNKYHNMTHPMKVWVSWGMFISSSDTQGWFRSLHRPLRQLVMNFLWFNAERILSFHWFHPHFRTSKMTNENNLLMKAVIWLDHTLECFDRFSAADSKLF